MTDAATRGPGPFGSPEANTSGRQGDVPTNPFMAALHRAAPDEVEKRRNWLLGHADSSTPTGLPDPAALVDELTDLRRQLAASENRAADAENALPHLMELGQRTVDGLLNDARRRGREIIESSRRQAADELGGQRDEVRREIKELDSLRMAVAAEAMGLEQVRAELQRRISRSASELNRMAEHPMLLGGELPVEDLAMAAAGLAANEIGPSPEVVADTPEPVVTLDALPADGPVGVVEASTSPQPSVEAQIEIAADATAADATPADDAVDLTSAFFAPAALVDPDTDEPEQGEAPASPSSRFADAWAADEDKHAADAFDRFFSADIDYEPSREWILADDTKE